MARVRALPPHPSLEQLKKQAKDLLAARQRGEGDAQARFGRCFGADAESFQLSQAQLVMAREQGFSSWRQLAAWVTRRQLPGAPAALVELLGARTGLVRKAAAAALTATGAAGVTAAMAGLSHPNPSVRRGAADFMDHHASDRCVPKLVELVLHDPVPYVRRTALHALGCQRCKPQPLAVDVTPLLIEMAKHDASWKARRGAVWELGQLQADGRVVEALQSVAVEDPHPVPRTAAQNALRRTRPGPAHREEAARRAREAKLAQAG